jgi:hypothetical protein
MTKNINAYVKSTDLRKCKSFQTVPLKRKPRNKSAMEEFYMQNIFGLQKRQSKFGTTRSVNYYKYPTFYLYIFSVTSQVHCALQYRPNTYLHIMYIYCTKRSTVTAAEKENYHADRWEAEYVIIS